MGQLTGSAAFSPVSDRDRPANPMASDGEDYVFFTGKEETDFGADNVFGTKTSLGGAFLSDSDTEPSQHSPSTEPASAVNEETGEINWDCPCLKSALEPPCGDTFRAAFSCFVASKVEPKGMDCHEFFKAMQECFLAHPEKYGPILDDGDADADDELPLSTSKASAAGF